MRITCALGILALVGLFASCETEIDITSDYARIPVVYGLLDQQVDTQFVMINRTFLGSGNAVEMAQIEDSMLYDDVDAKIYVIQRPENLPQDTVRTVTLEEIEIDYKDEDGIFYAPSAKVYYALSSEIWNSNDQALIAGENRYYQLKVVADGETIVAETRLTSAQGSFGTGVITQPSVSLTNDLNLVENFSPDGSTYRSGGLNTAWNSSIQTMIRNGLKQSLTLRFNYVEVDVNNVSTAKFIDLPYTQFDADVVNSPIGFEFNKSGEFLYRGIANNIETGQNIKYREVGEVEFILKVAGEDFTTYLNIGDPVSSVGQSRPSFSNINSGDGIGIFSSRDSYTRVKRIFNSGNDLDMREMADGQYTREFCFCDPQIGSTYDCSLPINQCQ
jgi:hypothetical protein